MSQCASTHFEHFNSRKATDNFVYKDAILIMVIFINVGKSIQCQHRLSIASMPSLSHQLSVLLYIFGCANSKNWSMVKEQVRLNIMAHSLLKYFSHYKQFFQNRIHDPKNFGPPWSTVVQGHLPSPKALIRNRLAAHSICAPGTNSTGWGECHGSRSFTLWKAFIDKHLTLRRLSINRNINILIRLWMHFNNFMYLIARYSS